MSVLSSTNVTYFRIVFLLSLAFLCLKDIGIILDHSFVMVLTQAMQLPALQLSPYSAQLGVFALLFTLSAFHDLIPLLENNMKFFKSIVPFRLMMFFIVTALSFLMTNNLYLHNNAVFIYCFCEVWINFLLYSALRDENVADMSSRNQFYSSIIDGTTEDLHPSTEREIQEMISDDEK